MQSERDLDNFDRYTIQLIQVDRYTYSLRIYETDTKLIRFEIPLDVMDRTVACALLPEQLGSKAKKILGRLSQFLPSQYGAKEFILVPQDQVLSTQIKIEDHKFDRVRHGDRKTLLAKTKEILEKYPEVLKEMNQYQVTSIDNLIQNKITNYADLLEFLLNYANFTEEKAQEYISEGVEGIQARFCNKYITSIALAKGQKLSGLARYLNMGNQFGYLSDETIIQCIIELDKFPGENTIEQIQNRAIFLLAYFVNKAAQQLQNFDTFVLIAAKGRESIYEAIGFQKFPLNSKQFTGTLTLVQEEMSLWKQLKNEILSAPVEEKQFSNATAIGTFGINQTKPVSSEMTANQIQNRRANYG